MTRLAGFVIRHSAFTIALVLAVTTVFAASLCVRGIGFNGSLETLAQGGADLEFYKETQRLFGDDRVIIAALTTRDVFTSSFIEKLDRLTKTLAALTIPGKEFLYLYKRNPAAITPANKPIIPTF